MKHHIAVKVKMKLLINMKKSIYTLAVFFSVVNGLFINETNAQGAKGSDVQVQLPSSSTGEPANDAWIFTVDSKTGKLPIVVSQGEFERQFLKNLNLKEKNKESVYLQ